MALTPLYTLAELDAEITQAKKDLATARTALSYQIEGGGVNRRFQREQVENLQKHLEWLQRQRASLEIGCGPQAVVGRPAR